MRQDGASRTRADDVLADVAEVDGARPVGLAAVELGPGALRRLPELLRPHLDAAADGPVAVLVDGVPMTIGGADLHPSVVSLLDGVREVRTVVVASHGGRAHANAETIDAAVRDVDGAVALVTVGSGTVADIGKAVSARLDGLPHAIVQTATSVNGYADDQSVLLVNGVKRTTPTRWPDILVADTDVLCEAPESLNAAGVGDLLAMFTAPADWRLASLLGMDDSYSEGLVQMVRRHGPDLLDAARGLRDRDPASVEYVARVLTVSGLSMGAAGTTAPSSGAEHTISHLIEMASTKADAPQAFHGAQVGVCTVLSALVWTRVRALLTRPAVRLSFPSEDEMRARVLAAFAPLDASGEMGEECWRLYRQKLARWNGARERLLATDWAAVEAEVAPMLGDPVALADALRDCGAPRRFADLDPAPSPETVTWALANCHLMRDRFSVVDLAFFLGAWGSDAPYEVLGHARGIGAGL